MASRSCEGGGGLRMLGMGNDYNSCRCFPAAEPRAGLSGGAPPLGLQQVVGPEHQGEEVEGGRGGSADGTFTSPPRRLTRSLHVRMTTSPAPPHPPPHPSSQVSITYSAAESSVLKQERGAALRFSFSYLYVRMCEQDIWGLKSGGSGFVLLCRKKRCEKKSQLLWLFLSVFILFFCGGGRGGL